MTRLVPLAILFLVLFLLRPKKKSGLPNVEEVNYGLSDPYLEVLWERVA